MPTECTNALSAYYIHLGYGQVSIVVLSVAVLYWLMSFVIMYWIKLQERRARSIHQAEIINNNEEFDRSNSIEDDGSGNIGVKSVIFPVFVKVMWLNSFVNIIVGVLLITIEDPDTYDHPTLRSTIVYSIIWGMQHFLIEGVAFLLMQKGLGVNSALKAVKWGIVWGAITAWMKFSTYYYTTQSANGYRLVWEIVLILFYLFLWICPQKHFYRRPAAVTYGAWWFCFRLISLISAVFLTRRQTRSVGSCVYIYAPMFIFSILQPYVIYYALLLDSLWWQGLIEYEPLSSPERSNNKNNNNSSSPDERDYTNGGGNWGSIVSPMQGLNMNLQSAQSLAETLDMLKSRATNAVRLLNFAYIKLDTDKLLGQGSFSKVYRGQYKQQECAVKLIFTVDLTVDVINRVAAESQILSSLQSVNVVNILGVAVLPPSMCILLEICEFGSLADVVKGRKEGSKLVYSPLNLSTIDLYYLALGCTRGLKAIHQLGKDDGSDNKDNRHGRLSTASIAAGKPGGEGPGYRKKVQFCHRDIKSLNFLVDGQLNAKVADLELGQEGCDQGFIKEWGGVSGDGLATNRINYGELFPCLHRTFTISAAGVDACRGMFGSMLSARRAHVWLGEEYSERERSSHGTESDMERATLNSGIRLSTLSKSHRDSSCSQSSDDAAVSVGFSTHSASQLNHAASLSLTPSAHSGIHLPTDDGILPNWNPPEAMADPSAYTQKSDIYSFGLVLWELFSREIPFERGELVSLPRPLPSRKVKPSTGAGTNTNTNTNTGTGVGVGVGVGSGVGYSDSAVGKGTGTGTQAEAEAGAPCGIVPPGLLKRDTVSMLVYKGFRPNLSTEPMDPLLSSDSSRSKSNESTAVGSDFPTAHYGDIDVYGQYTYNIPYKLRLLIAQCWASDPAQRPSLSRIILCLEQLLASTCYDHVPATVQLPSEYSSVSSIPSLLYEASLIPSASASVANTNDVDSSAAVGTAVDTVGTGTGTEHEFRVTLPMIHSSTVERSPNILAPTPPQAQLFTRLFGASIHPRLSSNHTQVPVSVPVPPTKTSSESASVRASGVEAEVGRMTVLTDLWTKLDKMSEVNNQAYCVICCSAPHYILRASSGWYDQFGYGMSDIGNLSLEQIFTSISPLSPLLTSTSTSLNKVRSAAPSNVSSISPPGPNRLAPALDVQTQGHLTRLYDALDQGKSHHVVLPVSNTAVGPSQRYSIFSYPLQLVVASNPDGVRSSSSDKELNPSVHSANATNGGDHSNVATNGGDHSNVATVDCEEEDEDCVVHGSIFDCGRIDSPLSDGGELATSSVTHAHASTNSAGAGIGPSEAYIGSLSQSYVLNNAFGWLKRARSSSKSLQPLASQMFTDDRSTSTSTPAGGTASLTGGTGSLLNGGGHNPATSPLSFTNHNVDQPLELDNVHILYFSLLQKDVPVGV